MSAQEQGQQHQFLMEEFRAGVTACLRSWSPLRAAVNSGWGGFESARKAEVLRDEIYTHFDGSSFPPKDMDIWDLEDMLAIYMEEEFSITLEDESEKQVALCIWHMYEDCSKGDVTLCRRTVQTAHAIEAQMNAFPVQVIEDEEMDEGDEDDNDNGDAPPTHPNATAAPTAAQAYASGTLFAMESRKPAAPSKPPRQLGEAPPEKPQVEVDEDGFAPITTKKKKNIGV
jgi:pre-rRNA-processing protein TSR2